jgi:hypothetical protein
MHGIHAHMAFAGRVEYVAVDEELQEIPWVKATDRDGKSTIYRSDGRAASAPPPAGQARSFDCMDCHNRSAHKFMSPQSAVNEALATGRIDTTLPFIKRQSVAALTAGQATKDDALRDIGRHITDYYKEHHPQVWSARKASVDQAVEVVRNLYASNIFPAMRENWHTYPDNVGHLHSVGCFRCHTEDHVNAAGQSLSYNCNACHTFLNDVTTAEGHTARIEGDFVHPIELNALHGGVSCHQCHTGGPMPLEHTCTGCHADQLAFLEGTTPAFQAFGIEEDAMAAVECEMCHAADEPFSLAALETACTGCHEDDEDITYTGLAGQWIEESRRLLDHAAKNASPSHQDVLELLDQVGPAHNLNATRAIVGKMTGGLPEGTVQPATQPGGQTGE